MHVIAGDGEMTKRELSATLEDLLNQAGDNPFWFLIHAKPEPTQTDTNLMTWLHDKEIYYEVIGSDIRGADDIYTGWQMKHEVKNLANKVVELMQSSPDENEEADLLALFVADEPDAEEDKVLYGVIQKVLEGGFKVYGLNDGMTEIGLEEGEGEEESDEESEEESPPPAAKKAAAKKAAGKARPLSAVPDPESDEGDDADPEPDGGDGDEEDGEEEDEEEDEEDDDESLTRAELEAMDLKDVVAYAANRGLELPPRTRKTTYIDKLLGDEEIEPEAEVEPVEEPEDEEEPEEDIEEEPEEGSDALNGLDAGAIAAQVLRHMVDIIKLGLEASQAG